MKIFLPLFALLALISASTTELRQRTQSDVTRPVDEPTVESLPSDCETPVEELVSSSTAVAPFPVTTPTVATASNRRDKMMTLMKTLPYLQVSCASLQYLIAAERVASSQLLCCPPHSTRSVYYSSLLLTLLSVFLAGFGPRWGSRAQDVSIGILIPEVLLMLAWTFGFFSMETGLQFHNFLQVAPMLIAATPVFLFFAFALGKLAESLEQ